MSGTDPIEHMPARPQLQPVRPRRRCSFREHAKHRRHDEEDLWVRVSMPRVHAGNGIEGGQRKSARGGLQAAPAVLTEAPRTYIILVNQVVNQEPHMVTDQLSVTFAALADPTRRAILARLAQGEATVT